MDYKYIDTHNWLGPSSSTDSYQRYKVQHPIDKRRCDSVEISHQYPREEVPIMRALHLPWPLVGHLSYGRPFQLLVLPSLLRFSYL